ncbi:MAG: UDP-N-acetylglucosamine 2-epimerase (non-hydrolyzing) [Spirochaetes bacterium]|nr:UDP-N-acetylglucosamine 2-epimerase (non-hydrolyzing) [Spirochaetota bacterium]
MKKKIISIIGARPQFIKCAPLSGVLREQYKEILVHTGQHYDRNMSRLFFEELNIPYPDYNLGIGSGSHGEQTGKMLQAIEKVLLKEKGNLVLCYGDTNSTLAAALAGAKLNIPVAHVEAGLRSFDRSMPEESNRIIADHVSDFLFVPSKAGMRNLKKEGLEDRAYMVGDIMYDALLENIPIAMKRSDIMDRMALKKNEYYLATVHRASNTDDRQNLAKILQAFTELDKVVVFPAHPRTAGFIKKYSIQFDKKKVRIIPPAGYLDILKLVKYCSKVLTDSGGLQKEAFYLKRQVVVLREESEWTELVEHGVSRLAGTDRTRIIKYALTDFRSKWNFYPYGKGDTAERIMRVLKNNI